MKTEKTNDLTRDERIAAAFADHARAADVAVLIDEAESAATAADVAAEQARALALDPTIPPSEVTAARRQMEDSSFARDRLRAALPRLRDRLRELRTGEEDVRRWAEYERVRVDRDRLAAEFAREYPKLAAQLADLVARLAANDRELSIVNDRERGRPSGAEHLRSAEEVARGKTFGDRVPRITRDLCLPALDAAQRDPYWPPAPRSVGSQAVGAPAEVRRFPTPPRSGAA